LIDIFLGTKAQYIKTAPLLRLMDAQDVAYRLIDSGQHAHFSRELRKSLQVREPDVALGSGDDITTVSEAMKWLIKYLLMTIFKPARLKREIFSPESTVCVIHGDTPSTLLSLIMAKRAGKKVAHLESGLRSFRWYRPFPEELIRTICARFCDVLFAPSGWAQENLEKMGVKGEIINIGQNTNVEALYYSLAKAEPIALQVNNYCVVTVHRVETILSKSRLTFVINLIRDLSRKHHVLFVMHPPTARKLEDYGLYPQLENIDNVTVEKLMKHERFLQILAAASFVVTDGGSIQEESFYLDVPCLVLRKETERLEGIGDNAVMGSFDSAKINNFLEHYDSYRSGKRIESLSPSTRILQRLLL
jgi:UDP-N-acetylglucosamine 2-epimerase (non-hydrolysing)